MQFISILYKSIKLATESGNSFQGKVKHEYQLWKKWKMGVGGSGVQSVPGDDLGIL